MNGESTAKSISAEQRVLDFRQPLYYPRQIAMSALADSPPEPKIAGVHYLLPMNADVMETRVTLSEPLTDEELLQFSGDHGDLRIEQTAAGELIIMAPTFGDTGNQEAELATDLILWSRAGGGGKVFGPSAGFKLPNGATLAPDVSWMSQATLDELPPGALHSFTPRCPDFVLELRSRSNRLSTLHAKMAEYIDNGARLGWLIDPLERQVFVYRPGESVEHLQTPTTVSGDPVLAGFTLDLSRVW